MSRSASTPPSARQTELRDALLARIPDAPRFVEARGILLEERFRIVGSADAAIIVSGDELLLDVVGRPPELAQQAAAAPAGASIIVQPDDAAWAAAELPEWTSTLAYIYTLRAPVRTDDAIPTRPLTRDDDLSGLSPEVRRELEQCIGRAPAIAAIADDGAAAAVCYAWKQSETLFDISIETLEAYRRRGLAGAAARRLIVDLADVGKRPVWGAADDNPASMHLASKLGFGAPEQLYVFERSAVAD